MLGVVTLASGFANLILFLIESYPATIVPEVQPYTTQSYFSFGKISFETSVIVFDILIRFSLVKGK